jgi:predicted dehydrogenase
MKALRVGMVGTGMAAESHAFDIVSSDELELVGVCSRNMANAASFAARFGAPHVFASVHDMLQSRTYESVVVAVPPHAVLDVSRLVLELGHPALIEKPVATSPQALATLVALAEATEAPAIAAFNRRYQRHVHTAVEALKTRALGQVHRVTACWSGPYESRYAAGTPTYRSRARKRLGLIADTGSHILDLLVWILGDSLIVESCDVQCNERGADINAFMTLSFGGDGSVRIVMSDCDSRLSERRHVRIETANGTITIDEDGAVLAPDNGPARMIAAEEYRRPVDDLLALRDGGAALGATLRDAVQVSRLLVAAYDLAGVPAPARWRHPRFKPWGRLNGSC